MLAATDRKIADDELLITRSFNAPLALVWRLWEDPDQMRRWWGPEGFHIRALQSDFRPGGKWRVHMWSQQYGDSFSAGEWRQIERPGRLTSPSPGRTAPASRPKRW